MKLVGRVPVEPLDDERLTNIERRIVAGAADAAAAGRRESRFGMTFGFAAATVAIALGAGLIGYRLHSAREEVAIESPIHVKTDAIATTLDIGDARITSDPLTQFDVTRPGGGVLIQMTRGKVALEVGKRGSRAPLVVRAGDTDVEVVGTRFTVDYGDGTGAVDVKVTEGVVKVKQRPINSETRVAAGEEWRIDRDGKVAFLDQAALLAQRDRTPDEIVIPIDPGIGLHERVAKVPDAKIPTAPQTGSNKPQQGPEYTRRPTLDPPTDPHLDLKKEIRGQTVMPALSVGNLVPAEAISRYRQMAAFGTQGAAATANDASMAFYSIAVVQHLKLGRDSDAIQTLDAYFRRFRPDATGYQAARWLQVRVRCLKAVDDQCRQAAFTYAHEFPSSAEARVADLLSVATE